jgi:hypothetical protein
VKIRALINLGTFHNYPDVRRGDVVEVDDDNARRYCELGYAEPAHKERPVEKAVVPEPHHETASLKVAPEPEPPKPKPLDEPKHEVHKRPVPTPPVKRRPGR